MIRYLHTGRFFPLFSSYIYHLVDSAWALHYTTFSVLRDFAADGVVYLELRTTPRTMPKAGLSKSQYVGAILAAISEFEAGDTALRTRLILSIDRRNTLEEALEVVALAREFRERGVVGIDLCGDPKKGGIASLAPAFRLARRELPDLGLTLHFAEAEQSGTDEELNMLLDWQPDRIGHVIHVGDEIKDRIIRTRGLGLELCLSCNVHANMITGGFEAHHFGEWWKVEQCVIALSVSYPGECVRCLPFSRRRPRRCADSEQTDDVGVFGSPLSNEYALVAKHFGLGRREICDLARGAIQVIFGSEEDKQRLRRIMWTE